MVLMCDMVSVIVLIPLENVELIQICDVFLLGHGMSYIEKSLIFSSRSIYAINIYIHGSIYLCYIYLKDKVIVYFYSYIFGLLQDYIWKQIDFLGNDYNYNIIRSYSVLSDAYELGLHPLFYVQLKSPLLSPTLL